MVVIWGGCLLLHNFNSIPPEKKKQFNQESADTHRRADGTDFMLSTAEAGRKYKSKITALHAMGLNSLYYCPLIPT